MLTLIEILKKSEEYLSKYGIRDARHNAELIASHALGKSRLDLYLEFDRPVQEEEIAKIRSAIAERKTHKPLQYIFSEAEFYGIRFKLTPDVLIPRPETEHLVEKALKSLKSIEAKRPVVYDVGTGSGCIAVSIAKQCTDCFVYASDISADALKIASVNAIDNGVSERMEFLLGHNFSPYANASTEKADIIVSNPPYIRTADIEKLQPEVKDFEPRKALDGGDDGLDIIGSLISGFVDFVKPYGMLIIEIGFGQSQEILKLIEKDNRLVLDTVVKDYQGIDRIVSIKLKETMV